MSLKILTHNFVKYFVDIKIINITVKFIKFFSFLNNRTNGPMTDGHGNKKHAGSTVDIIMVPTLGTAERFLSDPFLFSFPSIGPLTLLPFLCPRAAILSYNLDSVGSLSQHGKFEHNNFQLQVSSLTPNNVPTYLEMTKSM